MLLLNKIFPDTLKINKQTSCPIGQEQRIFDFDLINKTKTLKAKVKFEENSEMIDHFQILILPKVKLE